MSATSTAHVLKPTGIQKLANRTKKMRFPRRATQIQLQEDNGYSEDQFIAPSSNSIPWKSILLAVTLLVIGIVGITFGSLLKTGVLDSPEWLDKGTPLLIIGSLCFIPGAYHVVLAYYAYKQYDGYSFSLIPDLDD